MLKGDFEKNNQDDWLAKEIAREARISAWDLDEGKSLRKQHEENCDARQLADEHHGFHVRNQRSKKPQQKVSKWLAIDLIAVVILFCLSPFLPEESIYPAIILFLCLNPGIFVWLLFFRKMPSEWYLKLAFFLCLILELYILFIGNFHYLRYLIWRWMK